MRRRRLLARLQQGAVHNVAFNDFVDLVQGFGFVHARTRGSHEYYDHPGIPETLNLQPLDGEAKAYQIRQFLRRVREYGLTLEGD